MQDTFHKHHLAQEAEQEALADHEKYKKYLIEQAGKGENDFDKTVKMIEAEQKKLPKKDKDDGRRHEQGSSNAGK